MTTKDWIKIVIIGCILSFLINTPKFFLESKTVQEQSTAPVKTAIFPKGTFESEVKHTQ